MLNLLIAIVGKTNDKIESMNELIYEKNRVSIIKEYLDNKKNKEKMNGFLKEKYLIEVTRISSIEEEEKKDMNKGDSKALKKIIEKKLKVLIIRELKVF